MVRSCEIAWCDRLSMFLDFNLIAPSMQLCTCATIATIIKLLSCLTINLLTIQGTHTLSWLLKELCTFQLQVSMDAPA